MVTYGYIRTNRDQGPGHPGSDAEVQRRQLADAGVKHGRIYADVAGSGTKATRSRAQWHLLDQQLAHSDALVVAAVDRLGRHYLETMWAVYDLQAPRSPAAVPSRPRGPVDAVRVRGGRPRLA